MTCKPNPIPIFFPASSSSNKCPCIRRLESFSQNLTFNILFHNFDNFPFSKFAKFAKFCQPIKTSGFSSSTTAQTPRVKWSQKGRTILGPNSMIQKLNFEPNKFVRHIFVHKLHTPNWAHQSHYYPQISMPIHFQFI